MLKLHAGVSKKVGLPGFSSASASCTIEAELDGSLLNYHEGFQVVVRRAYHSCEQAVANQIARLQVEHENEVTVQENSALQNPDSVQGDQGQPRRMNGPQTRSQVPSRASQPVSQAHAHEIIEVRTSPAINGATVTAQSRTPSQRLQTQPSPRPATASQVKAIRAIAARRRIDLVGLLRDRFGLQTADELGIRDASNLIDELKSDDQNGASTIGHTNGTYATNGGAR